jgi:circadian clock protein KaiB
VTPADAGRDGSKLAFVLRLYVAGAAPHSVRAIENIQALCEQYGRDFYQLDVIDVLQEPGRALRDGILVTPTLLKLQPPPARTIVGDLGAPRVVLQALGLSTRGVE